MPQEGAETALRLMSNLAPSDTVGAGRVVVVLDALREKAKKLVHKRHYGLSQFVRTAGTSPQARLCKGAMPSPPGGEHVTQAELEQLPVLAPTTSKNAARGHNRWPADCPCTQPCRQLTGAADAVRPPVDASRPQLLAFHRRCISGSEGAVKAAADQRKPLHKDHFHTSDTHTPVVRGGAGGGKSASTHTKAGVLPFKHAGTAATPPTTVRKSTMSMQAVGLVRRVLGPGLTAAVSADRMESIAAMLVPSSQEAHDGVMAREVTVVSDAVDDVSAVNPLNTATPVRPAKRRRKAAPPPRPTTVEGWGTLGAERATNHADVSALRDTWIYKQLADPKMAFFYTREADLESLHLEFGYLNADGVLDVLTHDTSRKHSPQKSSGARQGRRGKLTSFEEYLFFKVAFTRFKETGLFLHCCHLFGMKVDLGRRACSKCTRGLGRFYLGQQHPASRTQAQSNISAKGRGLLNVDGKTACYLGDCTECKCARLRVLPC